jgi:Tfp pilus assembly protein PilN
MNASRKKLVGRTGADEGHAPFVPSLARVDLLPASVAESIALAKIRRILAIVFAVLLVAGVGLWWMQGSAIQQAEERLAVAQSENEVLQAQIARLAPINQVFEQIRTQQEIVETTLAAQPRAADVINALIEAGDTGGTPVRMSSISVDYRGVPVPGEVPNPCPNPNPFQTQVAIGCLTFTAIARDRAQVSEFLLGLESDPFFIGPYVSTTTVSGDGTVSFNGTAGVSTDALATPLSQERIDEILLAAEATDGGGA